MAGPSQGRDGNRGAGGRLPLEAGPLGTKTSDVVNADPERQYEDERGSKGGGVKRGGRETRKTEYFLEEKGTGGART